MKYLLGFLICLISFSSVSASSHSSKFPTPDTLVLVSQVNSSTFKIAKGDKLLIKTRSGKTVKGTLEEVGPYFAVIQGTKVDFRNITEVRYYSRKVRVFRNIVKTILGIAGAYSIVRFIINFRERKGLVDSLGNSTLGIILQIIVFIALLLISLAVAVITIGIVALIFALFTVGTIGFRRRFYIPRAYRIMSKFSK